MSNKSIVKRKNLMENEHNRYYDQYGEYYEEDEEEREQRLRGEYNSGLLKAARQGDLGEVKRFLEKGAQLMAEDKSKWNALVWAASVGSADVVRFLLSKGAGTVYRKDYASSKSSSQGPAKDSSMLLTSNSLTFEDPSHQQKAEKTNGPGIVNEKARSTPLQWACFKGHPQVVALLLKDGHDLLETDKFGNNCIHQAVAGGHVPTFRLLLQWGIKLHYLNNRGHSVIDLCTNPEIMKYIKKFKDAELALGIDPREEKPIYLCSISDNFFPEKEINRFWLYETKDSADMEKFETRSHREHNQVLRHQDELMELIRNNDYGALTTKLKFITDKGIHIETKLLAKGIAHQEKLRIQIEIMDFIQSVNEIDNYKTIKKTINTLEEKVRDALVRGVDLDQSICDAVKGCADRLLAERNLRFELDNLQISSIKPEEIKTLEERKNEAKELHVAEKFLETAEVLKTRMEKHLHAKEILKRFQEYPVRPAYPLVKYTFDMKCGKKLDKITKKIIDPTKLYPPAPKGRGRKPAKWVLPDWAVNTAELRAHMNTLNDYIANRVELELNDEFVTACQAQLPRMKEEYELRVELDKEARFEEEKKAKQKKKK